MQIQHLKKNLNHHIITVFFRNNNYALIKNRNEKLSSSIVGDKALFISKRALPCLAKSFFLSLNLVNAKDSSSLHTYYVKLRKNKSKILIHTVKLKFFLLNGSKIFKIFFFLDFLLLIKLKVFFSSIFLRYNFFLSNRF